MVTIKELEEENEFLRHFAESLDDVRAGRLEEFKPPQKRK
jgi:hypothetical protein